VRGVDGDIGHAGLEHAVERHGQGQASGEADGDEGLFLLLLLLVRGGADDLVMN